MNASHLINYLNEYLRTDDIPDYKPAFNGLQVEGPQDVTRVVVAVDACQFTVDAAAASGAHLLIVHHGLFWGSTVPVTGLYFKRLSALIQSNVGLYSCHLPLDVHPEVGNNHVLARKLGLTADGSFCDFEGTPIGVIASAQLSLSEFTGRVRSVLGIEPIVITGGSCQVRRVGILTGGGGSAIAAAACAGIDTYLTGEGNHHTYFDAEELGINVIYAGHYATETVGVQALGEHLASLFGLDVQFIDHPTGL